MTAREWPRLAAGSVLLLALTAFVIARWRMTTDVAQFLPGGEASARADLARQIAMGELSRTMIVLVTATDGDEAALVSREMEAALRADAEAIAALEAIEAGPAEGFEEALWRTYQPRRFAFAADSVDAARERITAAGVAAAVARLKQQLALPTSGLTSRVAPEDPFLILPGLFERIMGSSGEGLSLVDGRFVATDGRSAVLFLASRAGASDSTLQRPLLAGIERAFAQVDRAHGDRLVLHQSGTNRHAIHAEDAMKGDVQRVSVGSFAGMLVLVMLFGPRRLPRSPFRALLLRFFAPLLLPLSWLPVLAMGFLVGAATCLAVFGQVHGMTLAFGASLIGVSIDYAVHFYCHEAMGPEPDGPRATLRRIWPGLVLGAATTVVGFVVLLVATFPGLRELALFAASGLAASLLATYLFLPGMVRNIRATRAADTIVAWLRVLPGLRGWRRLWLIGPIGGAIVVCAIGLPQARWNDSLSSLNRIDPRLEAEDHFVLDRVLRVEQRRIVVAVGADEEAALQHNDRVAVVLAAAQAAGELAGCRNVAAVLPSAARQRTIDAAMRSDPTLADRMSNALAEAGFVAERFEPFRAALASPAPMPLTPADLVATPLGAMVRPFLLPLADGRVAVLSFLRELRDEQALRARLDGIEGATIVDIEQALTEALAAYRERMATLLSFGVLAVIGLVVLRYRRRSLVVLACVPALLGAATTVAALALFGIELNLLSLVALLMIVSMAVDYGIFLAEDRDDHGSRNATQIGVLIDGLTTILGFGLLAMSEQPALYGIGMTSGLGISLCLVLALTFGALVGPAKESSS